jgi:hypothetical protein
VLISLRLITALRQKRKDKENQKESMNIDYHSIILGTLWIGGLNVIILLSLKRQNLSLKHLLTPTFIAKLQGKDWLLVIVLVVLTMIIGTYFD